MRNLQDSIKLKSLLLKSENVLIIGAGFIGLEVASIAKLLNKDVTIIENSSKVMGRNLSDELSEWYINYHNKKGIKFLFNETISSINSEKGVINSIKTSKNSNLNTDCLLIAIGSYPETSLGEAINLDIKDGICVNKYMQTNDRNIYAVGDCTNFIFGSKNIRLESIQNAVDQSKVAALNILNIKNKYFPIPWFWSDQFDLKLQIVGIHSNIKKNKEIKVLGSKSDLKFSNFIFENEKLMSIESINSPSHHLLLRNNFQIWSSIKPNMICEDLDLKLFIKSLN